MGLEYKGKVAMVEAMEGGGARLSDLAGPKSHHGEFGL